MAVIIGNSSTVAVAFNNGPTIDYGIKSVDWNVGTNPNRLYTLGTGLGSCGTKEFAIIRQAACTVNFGVYAGVTPEVSLCPTEICQNSPASAVITIVPGVCGGVQVDTFNQMIFFNSYTYNKDRTTIAEEQWASTAYVSESVQNTGNCDIYTEPTPTFVIGGVAEGTLVGDTNLNDLQDLTGARLRADSCTVITSKGNVQAGPTSIGEYDITYHGTFRSIGNSIRWREGVKANASVTIALQPIYLGT